MTRRTWCVSLVSAPLRAGRVRPVAASPRLRGAKTMADRPAHLHDPASVARARRHRLPADVERLLRPLSDALCDPARFRMLQALSEVSLSVKDLAAVVGRS